MKHKSFPNTFYILLMIWSTLFISNSPPSYYILSQENMLFLPLVFKSSGAPSSQEWNQFAHDAQHTSYTPLSISTPWSWKWSWNGPDAAGNISDGKFGLPRNSQPITGNGLVYLAAGAYGLYALNNVSGAEVWNFRPAQGSALSTPAYDPDTQSVFTLFSNGKLYKLNATNGQVLAQINMNTQSNLPLPPVIAGEKVFFGMGYSFLAADKFSMQTLWQYDPQSPIHTPPAYSSEYDLVVFATQDLYVHAVRASDGVRVWRVKPTERVSGNLDDPNDPNTTNYAEVLNGWPVIADKHGIVFIRYRLDWQSMWDWNPQELPTNLLMRQFLSAENRRQCLFALRLSDGSTAFIPNVGNGGFGDGGYLPMGPLPVIKPLDENRQIAYVVMRGYPCLSGSPYCDSRGDSRLGEMVLDDSTVDGYLAGYVRYMENTYFPTDEQAFLSMAGDTIFAGHWEAGIAHQIADRSPSKGSNTNPITVTNLPHIVTSQDVDACNTGFLSSHYCETQLINTRYWPSGFYIYWQQGNVYDQYWSEYAQWVISLDTIYFVSTDGAIVALEHGDPSAIAFHPKINDLGTFSFMPPMLPPRRAITPDETWSFVGQRVIVEGKLVSVFDNGKAFYLTFHHPYHKRFVVRILREDWLHFPAPLDQLFAPGQVIQVTGTIDWYQGAPAMIITSMDQIHILP